MPDSSGYVCKRPKPLPRREGQTGTLTGKKRTRGMENRYRFKTLTIDTEGELIEEMPWDDATKEKCSFSEEEIITLEENGILWRGETLFTLEED